MRSFPSRCLSAPVLGLLACLALACSQNGTTKGSPSASSSGSLTVTLDKGAVTLNGVVTGVAPSTTVQVTYSGASLVAGIAPGANTAPWLTLTPINLTTGQSTYNLIASTSTAVGSYSTTLRFQTSKADGTGATYVDLPVSFTLAAADVAGAAAPAPPALEAHPLTAEEEAQAREAGMTRILHITREP